jgi:hypothetical protein
VKKKKRKEKKRKLSLATNAMNKSKLMWMKNLLKSVGEVLKCFNWRLTCSFCKVPNIYTARRQ